MSHIFLSFLFFNVILFIFYNHYKRGHYYIKKSNLVLYTILLIAFATYGTGEGDYLHYKENVALFESMFDVMRYNGMEIQYNYLAYIVGGNYTLWRLVIFSIQFIGMSWLLHKAEYISRLFEYYNNLLIVIHISTLILGSYILFYGNILAFREEEPILPDYCSLMLCVAYTKYHTFSTSTIVFY